MDLDETSGSRRSDPLAMLVREDLDPLSVEELAARIAALEREIERSRTRMARAASQRASADALFRA